MHGYEMIQEIAERSQDLWRPSPGSVYPTLQLLEDEGLIVVSKTDASEGSKKLFELTDQGRAAAAKVETAPWDEIAEGADPAQVNLRAAIGQLFGAAGQDGPPTVPDLVGKGHAGSSSGKRWPIKGARGRISRRGSRQETRR